MKIPFQDTREAANPRWTDLVKLQEIRFFQLCDLIEHCNGLTTMQLLELQKKIDNKIKAR